MTSRKMGLNIHGWLTEPPDKDVQERIQFMSQLDDVAGIAVMPDVHLSNDFCIGTVVATESRIYPGAIGQDIGCGMTAIGFECDADSITSDIAAKIMATMKRFIPIHRHRLKPTDAEPVADLGEAVLSDERLKKLSRREGRVQLGTLGRGNHFLELQADAENRVWAMVHSGSRGMGHAITAHHLRRAKTTRRCSYFHADSEEGRNYLNDADWAMAYAKRSRLQMIWAVGEILEILVGGKPMHDSLFDSNHNHVRRELHCGSPLWVHRKGAQSARVDEIGVIPGSMGTSTFHVEGRGCATSFSSCSHGAGRKLSRTEARKRISDRQVREELERVHHQMPAHLSVREEAPSAYKDIKKVMRAQKELVCIRRELRPLLTYKGY